ncbi:flavin-containing monooxygenase [Rufibacter latericius]|uniref:Oxidoreductase n=1 Tax=Rufibacter latericius TaxID=2487040 RepID=A0A3M9MKQ3_9BACT|nr:NAD(P)-binding domain-containing protein [Rufibacter latericius]RNI26152.1 oxidoreductase [Rufibacter latericius]
MQTRSEPILSPESGNSYDVIVIGAGQAGLAMGYYLHLQRKNFLLLDAAAQVGDSWRARYDSLRLFTPAEYCSLPGWPLLLPKGYYPTKDEIASYLQQYAAQFQLPVKLKQPVVSMSKANGTFQIQTPTQVCQARQVVIATGPFQTPFVPDIAKTLPPEITQLHSSQYRNPSQVPNGNVLVVGAGNSGAQIAVELAQTHEVQVSVKRKPRFSALRMLGQSVFWWATQTGAIYASPSSRVGKKVLQKSDVIYGQDFQKLLKKGEVLLRSEIVALKEQEMVFKDGSRATFNSIIWATGFRPEYGWLQVEGALAENGHPIHKQGVSPVEGLFYLGLSWQRSRSSALLLGAGHDAQFIAQRLV